MKKMRRGLHILAVMFGAPALVMCATNEATDEGEFHIPDPPPPSSGGLVDPPPLVEPDAGEPECADLLCKVPTCEDGKTTTISGTVYAPNGTLPLYNAMVYIPTEPWSRSREASRATAVDRS